MSNSKISALTSATTPLAGTEVLPIVQSTTTKQVSVANLTAGRTQTSNGIVQGAAATGYNFTANTPAAGKTSQLLNWYEEGTWSPIYQTTGGAFTYAFQVGAYVRVGKLVTVTGVLQTATVTAGTGSVKLGGLPFPTNASAVYRGGSGIIGYSDGWTLAAPTQAYWTEGQSYVNLQIYGAAGTVDLTAANLTAGVGNRIYFQFSYNV